MITGSVIGKLLPVMKGSGDDVIIVLVSSDVYKWTKYDISLMNYTGDPETYSMLTCYGRSKLYNVIPVVNTSLKEKLIALETF